MRTKTTICTYTSTLRTIYLTHILAIRTLRTNAQNDALLHKLVHTKLLSGSLSSELDLTPAQRRKALAGRVLEAAGQVKLGKGENVVRAKERNKAAKHVRDGLVAKQKERKEKALEEVCRAQTQTQLSVGC